MHSCGQDMTKIEVQRDGMQPLEISFSPWSKLWTTKEKRKMTNANVYMEEERRMRGQQYLSPRHSSFFVISIQPLLSLAMIAIFLLFLLQKIKMLFSMRSSRISFLTVYERLSAFFLKFVTHSLIQIDYVHYYPPSSDIIYFMARSFFLAFYFTLTINIFMRIGHLVVSHL